MRLLHHVHPTRTLNLASQLVVRDSSSSPSSTCAKGDNSGSCQKPESTNSLAIGLGVGVPVLCAIIAIIILHYRHLRKLKKEELENQHIDVDMDDYDHQNVELGQLREKPGYDYKSNEYHDGATDDGSSSASYDNGSRLEKGSHGLHGLHGAPGTPAMGGQLGRSMADPFYATAPYISDTANGSKISLDEYSKSLKSMSEQVFPSNASVYSVASSSPRLPMPAHVKNSVYSDSGLPPLGRVSSNNSQMSAPPAPLSRNTPSPSLASNTPPPVVPYVQRQQQLSKLAEAENSDREKSPFGDDAEQSDHKQLDATPDDSRFSYDENRKSYRLKKTATAQSSNNFDFDTNQQDDKFVLQDSDDEQDQDHHQHPEQLSHSHSEASDLHRNDTKHFERVRSVYKEYMDGEDEDDTPPQLQPVASEPSHPAVAHDDVAHPRPEDEPRMPELDVDNGTPVSSASPPEFDTSLAAPSREESMYADDTRSSVYSAMPEATKPMPMPVEPLQTARYAKAKGPQGPQGPHSQAPYGYNGNGYGQPSPHYPNSPYSPGYAGSGQPSPGYAGSGQPSPGYPGSGQLSPADRPDSSSSLMHGSISQQAARVELPELTTLPNPHSLKEIDNPLAFAPQRRIKTGGNAPSNGTHSPRLGLATAPGKRAGEALPSPHAFRGSVVMSSLDFAPPKKYHPATNGPHSRSNSLTSPASTTFDRSVAGSGPPSPHMGSTSGSFTELVPGKNDSMLLRPTMEMRS